MRPQAVHREHASGTVAPFIGVIGPCRHASHAYCVLRRPPPSAPGDRVRFGAGRGGRARIPGGRRSVYCSGDSADLVPGSLSRLIYGRIELHHMYVQVLVRTQRATCYRCNDALSKSMVTTSIWCTRTSVSDRCVTMALRRRRLHCRRRKCETQ